VNPTWRVAVRERGGDARNRGSVSWRLVEAAGPTGIKAEQSSTSARATTSQDAAPSSTQADVLPQLGRLMLLRDTGSIRPRQILAGHALLGNHVMQRVLAARPTETPAHGVVQRRYIVDPVQLAVENDFRETKFSKLRDCIQKYQRAGRARLELRLQRLLEVNNEVLDVANKVLSPSERRNLETLSTEIQTEHARLTATQTAPPSQPAQNVVQPPSQPPAQNVVQPPSQPVVQPPAQNVVQPPSQAVVQPPSQPVVVEPPSLPVIQPPLQPVREAPPQPVVEAPLSTAPQRPDPRLLAEHRAEQDVPQRIIAPRTTWTQLSNEASFSSQDRRAGRLLRTETITHYTLPAGSSISPSPLQWRVPGNSSIRDDAGDEYSVSAQGWTLTQQDVDTSGARPRVRAQNVWYTLESGNLQTPPRQTATNNWTVAAADLRGVAPNREVQAGGAWYTLVNDGDLVRHDTLYEIINLNGEEVRVEAREGNLSTGALGFQPLPVDAPLFPQPPTAADIKQLGLGDCYLQAVLVSIATQNPQHLQTMLTDNRDGTVSAHFYTVDERNATAPAYALEEVRVAKSLPQSATGEALYQGGATWARLLQKAFAAFAQRHGQYGVAYQPDKGEGYQQIAGGVAYKVYGVFYGPAREAAGFERTSYRPDQANSANLQANAPVILKLLQFAGQDRTITDAGKQMHLTVGATLRAHIIRADSVVRRINTSTAPTDLRGTWGRMASNLPNVVHNLNLPTMANTDDIDVPGVQVIIDDARRLAEMPSLKRWVNSERTNAHLAAFFELLNDIKEGGTDTSPGQRFSYSGHAYAIVRVRFQPRTPDPANLTSTALGAIDINATTVTLRNPHGTNSPNAYEIRQNDNGEFDLSLAQFLRNFSELEYGLVRATR
jgi:hypothetical protein